MLRQNMPVSLHKYLVILFTLWALFALGCSADQSTSIPADFFFVMDVQNADKEAAQNINIRINARGEAEFEIYDTGGVIHYDPNDIVIYDAEQVVETGKFELSDAELEQLWNAINANKFFELETESQMAIGHSYAFIMVEADGRRHQVDNIGLEMPEVRALVETIDAIMPEGINLEYGEGYVP